MGAGEIFGPPRPVRLAYVLGEFPARSQTFVLREIRALLGLGADIQIFALGRGRGVSLGAEDQAWAGRVRYVPQFGSWSLILGHLRCLVSAPARYVAALACLLRLKHRPRYLVLRALYGFWRSAWVARQILGSGGVRHIHAHFALSQTELAMAVAELLGCSYSFTAHARDIYWTPNALPDKIRAARFVVTCTRYNQDYLRRICPDVPQAHIVMIRHGIEPPASKEPAPAPGRWSPSERPMLLSAGRLIAKKGFDVLIDACAILRRRGIGFACAIAGDGPLETALRRKIARLELDGLVQLIGWQPYSRMAELYQNATMFLLPSRVTDTGDRDGTPNVLIEALAFGLPCISTSVSGIPELIEHGRTGLLIPQDNPEAVAEAVESLLRSPEFATDLGRMGRRKVLEEFDLKTNTLQLARLFSLRTA